MRILLVEDDEDLGSEIARALRAENFAVDLARNGEDGLHLGDTERYDAAVLDLGLPVIDGLSVLAAWRKAGSWRRTTSPRPPRPSVTVSPSAASTSRVTTSR